MRFKMYKILATCGNKNVAIGHRDAQAKRLRKLGMTDEFRVGIESDEYGHHVILYKRK